MAVTRRTSWPPHPHPQAPAGTVLAALSSVPVGHAVSATGKDGARLIVAQPKKGSVAAFFGLVAALPSTLAGPAPSRRE